MEFLNEYGLLVAVALPVAVIVAINVLLAIGGERGTLLLPSLKPYPSVYTPALQAMPEAAAAPVATIARPSRPAVEEGFDEADELLARHAA